MSQREAFITALESKIGYVEGPKDNETIFGAFTKANFLPWCGSFMMWGAAQADVKIPNCVSTVAGAEAFKKAEHLENQKMQGHQSEDGIRLLANVRLS